MAPPRLVRAIGKLDLTAGVAFCLGLLATRSFAQIWWLLLILAGGFLLRFTVRPRAAVTGLP